MKPSAIDFQPYLTAIAHLYSQQNALYTPTDALLPLEARSVEQQDTQRPQERQVEQFPVLTGLQKYALGEEREHVLLAGRPGSGKSTALKQLAVALAEEGQVPVLVQLKGDRTVPELIQAEFRRAKQRVTLEQIEDWLLADQLILLLDGVNEIPNDDLRRGLVQFREDNSTVPMIFTTRELAVGGDLGIGKRLEMKPLSEPQMREFVQKYLPEQGEQLLTQLRDRLREIAETPLFLKMLCDVFKQTKKIPQNKGELFRQFDRNYERLKKDYAPVSKNFWEFKSEVLQHLAFSMIQADVQKPTDLWLTISKHRAESLLENWLNQRGVVDAPTKAKEWLKDLCNHHLLQDAAKPGEIEFHHQLFQEYYAAEYLLQLLPSLNDEQLKRDYLNYLKWTEAIALMLALVDEEAQALRVVKLAMYDIDLMLGARLAGEVQSAVQATTIAWIDALQISHELKRQCCIKSRSEQVIPVLLHSVEDSDEMFRMRAVEALGQLSSEKAISVLLYALEDPSIFVGWRAAEAIGQLGNEKAIPGLLRALEHPKSSIRGNAAWALGQLGSEQAIDGLLRALEDPKSKVRENAAEALGKLGGEQAIPGLLCALEDFESSVCVSAAEALGKLGSEAAIPSLLRALEDRDSNVRMKAVNALGKLGSEAAIPGLICALEHAGSNVRGGAAWALGYLGSKTAVPSLLRALQDPNNGVRDIAAWALGELGSEAAIPGLCRALQDQYSNVRGSAALALGKLGNEAATSGLCRALQDQYSNVRGSAALALGKLGSEEVIPDLLRALQDQESEVCRKVALALGELGSEKAIPGLLSALKAPSLDVRRGAALALGELGSEKAIPSLLLALKAPSLDVRKRAALALGQLGSPKPLAELWRRQRNSSYTHIYEAIAAIQNRCKYYNHEIAYGLIPQGKAIALFFSYASKDEALQNELAKHLNLLERQGVITSWNSRQILPGDEREQVISQQLNTADIILLLISSDSIADNTCYDLEIRRAMERHQAGEAHVIPILLRSVDWTGAPFSQVPVLPKNKQPVTTWDNQDEAFREVAEGIRAVAIGLRRRNGIKGA